MEKPQNNLALKTTKKTKGQLTMGENFSDHATKKGLLSKIYKQYTIQPQKSQQPNGIGGKRPA